jgi:hypothetical protein
LTSADFEKGRLAVDSFFRPNRLFTVERSVVLYSAADADPASKGCTRSVAAGVAQICNLP